MKIRNLLLTGMCALSMGAFAATGTVIYTESFGENTWHQGIANVTGEMKAGSQYYFDDPVYIHGNWASETRTWPNASGGSVLGYDATHTQLRIKVNTAAYPYALFTYAACWDGVTAAYSFDGGSTYTPFTDAQIATYGDWRYIQFAENIGGKAEVIIRLTPDSGTPQVDDPTVTGYDQVPLNLFVLNTAISAVDDFISGDGMNPEYCFNTVLAFTNSEAYTNAISVRDNPGSTQSEVDAAATTLTTALDALKATALDFTDLEASIAAAQEYATDSHVVGPMAAAEQLLTGTLVGGACAIQSDLEAAKAVLDQAVIDAISVDGVAAGTFGLYPNPANDFIRIDGIENGTVYIFDAAGKQMLSVAGYNGEDINITTLSPGVYTAAYGKTAISFIKE